MAQSGARDHGVSITKRICCLIIGAAATYSFELIVISWQHAHALLLERVFVLGLDRSVDDALEHLNNKEKKHVSPIH